MEIVKRHQELTVYKKAFDDAMEIFKTSKNFPSSEKYSLSSQITRSSRSVCANIAEAWRKRKYIAMFRNKLTDSMMEAAETQTWLEFALACEYIDLNLYEKLIEDYEEILRMLNSMEKNAESFCFTD
ncbi:MAG: four helix bundle protein [Acidobacteriota bacterium]